MELNPEQASFLLNVMLPSILHEHKTTLKIMKAVPADKGDYRPDPVSMTAMDLCWHTAFVELMFMEAAINGTFAPPARPETVKTPADVAAWYEATFAANKDKIGEVTGEKLITKIQFHHFNMTALEYLQLMTAHSIHHRGQLSVYLRPMGAKVPSIYGTSADDKAAAAAAAQTN